MWLRLRAIMQKRTLSPLSADMEFRSATNMGLSLPSGVMLLRPLAFAWKVPSMTCVLSASLYDESETFTRKSSHAMSSMMSMASIFMGWVSSLRLRKRSLKETV